MPVAARWAGRAWLALPHRRWQGGPRRRELRRKARLSLGLPPGLCPESPALPRLTDALVGAVCSLPLSRLLTGSPWSVWPQLTYSISPLMATAVAVPVVGARHKALCFSFQLCTALRDIDPTLWI